LVVELLEGLMSVWMNTLKEETLKQPLVGTFSYLFLNKPLSVYPLLGSEGASSFTSARGVSASSQ
jgi:hypothetical protein